MTDLPVIDPDVERQHPNRTVAGVLLAAGGSHRYGEANKLLESVDGAALVRQAVGPLVESKLSSVTVVLGYEADRVRTALADFPVEFRYNDDYEQGQSTSVGIGVDIARAEDADGVLFGLGDMPAICPSSVDRLLEAYAGGHGTALAAGYEGGRGNPVLFDRCHFDALEAITGDVGGRSVLLEAEDGAIVETGDPGVRRDIDRPTDH